MWAYIEYTSTMHTYLIFCLGMVDTIFADVAQPDQARIVAINAHNFLKNGGHFVISIKVIYFSYKTVTLHDTFYYYIPILRQIFLATHEAI